MVAPGQTGLQPSTVKAEENASSNPTATTVQHAAVAGDALLLAHISVKHIADRYAVEKLSQLAKVKFDKILWSKPVDETWLPALPKAVKAAEIAGDGELRLNLAAAAAAHLPKLVVLDTLSDLDIKSDFKYEVLKNCAQRTVATEKQIIQDKLQAHTQKNKITASAQAEMVRRKAVADAELAQCKMRAAAEVGHYKAAADAASLELANLKTKTTNLEGVLSILRTTSRCRNGSCGMKFSCYIDKDENILRCAKCWCRHYPNNPAPV